MSLPGNKVATLPITEISPAYTNQLQKLAQATDVDATEVRNTSIRLYFYQNKVHIQ